ncbi:hypothetical protein ACF1DY_01695 [Streptomyces albus]
MVLAKIGASLGICGGVILLVPAIAHDAPAIAIAGGTICISSLIALSLLYVRGWICDTTAARARLDETRAKLESERRDYVAFKAVLQAERDRHRSEIAASRAALSEQLRIEKEKLAQEFEDERGELMRSSFEMGVVYAHRGDFEDVPRAQAQVIQLPERASQHPETAFRPAP